MDITKVLDTTTFSVVVDPLHTVPSYKERLYKEHQLSQKNLKNKDQLTFGQLKNVFFKSTSQNPLLKEHQTGKFVKM